MVSDLYLKGNKTENRPHYYCLTDKMISGLYWVIPLSSKIDKYRKIISVSEQKYGRCDYVYICEVHGKEQAFLIQDMFPITAKFIKREYTVNGDHLILENSKDIKEIEAKAKRIMSIMKRNERYKQNHVDTDRIISLLYEDESD